MNEVSIMDLRIILVDVLSKIVLFLILLKCFMSLYEIIKVGYWFKIIMFYFNKLMVLLSIILFKINVFLMEFLLIF